MKTVLLAVLMMVAGMLWLQAQTEAGKVLLGTSTNLYGTIMGDCPNTVGVYFSSSKYKSDSYKSDGSRLSAFNLSPRIGVFAIDHLLIGVDVSYIYQRDKDKDYDVTSTVTVLSAGPYGRYYFDLVGFKPFVQAGMKAGQTTYKESSEYGNNESKSNFLSFGGGVGAAFFISEKVSIDLLGNFVHITSKPDDNPNNSKNLSTGFGLGLGLSVFL